MELKGLNLTLKLAVSVSATAYKICKLGEPVLNYSPMTLFMIPPTWLLLLTLSSLLLIGTKIRNNKNKHNPPSPPKLPLIGHLHQLGTLPHRTLSTLSKTHGPVMLLRLGTVPTVVISSPGAARQVLKIHDLAACSRPPLAGPRRLSYNYLDMGFSPYNRHWREMRKLCALELFSAKRARAFRGAREEEVSSMVDDIAQTSIGPSGEGPVDVTERVFALVASVVFKIAFGKAYEGGEFGGERVRAVVEEAEELLGCFFASDFFPWVGWIIDRLTGLHARLERSFHQLDRFFEYVINDHLDPKREKPEQEDIVDVLLRIEEEQKKADEGHFTRDHIKAMLMDIFLAGVQTSAVAIVWAMAELARNPRIMNKAQTEVRDRAAKKGKVIEEDIDDLPYLKMVVKETLRLHPPVPLLLAREAMSHFKVDGYDIRPKTRIEVNVWAIGRDPEYWENPDEFYPERFADSSIDYKGSDFEFLPFGAGRRSCPGLYMGMAIVELTLANLLYSFDWKLPSGMEEGDIDMEEGPGISCPKKTSLELVPVRYQCP